MTRGEHFISKRNFKIIHFWAMLNQACCNLNSKSDVLNCMVIVIILNINVKNKIHLLENKLNSKARVLKTQRKKYSKVVRGLGIHFSSQQKTL